MTSTEPNGIASAAMSNGESTKPPDIATRSIAGNDLGLAQAFAGPLRFEVEGANAARRFAQAEGVDGRRAQLIWDGVALNSPPSLGLHKEVEVSLCTTATLKICACSSSSSRRSTAARLTPPGWRIAKCGLMSFGDSPATPFGSSTWTNPSSPEWSDARGAIVAALSWRDSSFF